MFLISRDDAAFNLKERKEREVNERLNEKNLFFAENEEDLAKTIINFAFVCKGTLKDFENIRDYILRFSEAKLIYQTKAIEPLFITRKKPEEGLKS